MTRGRRIRARVAAAMLTLLLAGCVAPAFDSGAFRENAIGALASATSSSRSAVLALRARLTGDATQAYADTVVTDMEESLAPVEASFGDVDPSGRADDALREQVMGLLGDTSGALATARINLRRQDLPAVRQSVQELTALADRLEQVSEGLRQ